MIRESIQYITIVNTYALNLRSTSIYKTNANSHKSTSQQKHKNSGDFNAPLTSMNGSEKKVNKET